MACLVVSGAGCGPALSMTRATPATLAADSAIKNAVAVESALDPATFPPTSVGVLPLRVVSGDSTLTPLGFGLADLLTGDLARSRAVQVVDRLRIQSLLRELLITGSGVADTATGPRLGRILGARFLVAGQLAVNQRDEVRLDAVLAVTESGAVQPVVSGDASLDEILDVEKALAFRVFDALGVVLTPAERAAVEQRPTRHLGALLAYGRGVQAESELRFGDAWVQYREAVRLDPSFQAARARTADLEATLSDPLAVGNASVDAINRPYLPFLGDIADPAFPSGERATLVIPVIIR
jgi:TolB-like protein